MAVRFSNTNFNFKPREFRASLKPQHLSKVGIEVRVTKFPHGVCSQSVFEEGLGLHFEDSCAG